jgi:hypothetical protein
MVTKTLQTKYRTSQKVDQWVKGKSPTYTSNTDGAFIGANSTFTGQENPRWRSQVAKHVQAGTPASGLSFRVIAAKRLQFSAYTKGTGVNAGRTRGLDYYGLPDLSSIGSAGLDINTPLPVQSADNDAIKRLHEELESLRNRVPQGENLGQITQTYHSITKPLGGILNATRYLVDNHVRLLKKARWNNTKVIAKAFGSSVIEYRFGIEPLIKDVREIGVALQDRNSIVEYTPFKVKSSAYRSDSIATHTLSGVNNGGWSPRGIGTNVGITRVRYKGQLKNECTIPQSLPDVLGLTWRDFVPTCWALTPYSFLLDYVLNVDDLLTAFYSPWNDVAWCSKTQRDIREYRWSCPSGAWSKTTFVDWGGASAYTAQRPGQFVSQLTAFTRAAVTDKPVPQLQLMWPKTRHLQNSAALIASRLPVIGRLWKHMGSSRVGKSLDRDFKLVTRDRNLKVPYPFHQGRS